MYFKDINTIDEAKNLFRDLCKKLHPDTSGYNSESDFIKMYNEFRNFKSKNEDENENFDADIFYNLLKNFDELFDIQISFVGSFIWLEDLKPSALYQQKEIIKSIMIENYNTARFAPKKKCWYFSPVDYKKKSRGTKDLEEIKNTYGNRAYKTKTLYELS